MAAPGTETRPGRGGAQAKRGEPEAGARAGLAPTLALSLALGLAAFTVLAAIVVSLSTPTPLPPPLGEENQRAETLLYLAAFLVILPGALFAGQRLADRIARGPNATGLPLLVWVLVIALMGGLLAAKASSRLPWDDGVVVAGTMAALWLAAAGAAIARTARPTPWPLLLRFTGLSAAAAAAVPAAVLAAVLCFAALDSITPAALLVAAVAAVLILALYRRRPAIALSRPWGPLADGLILAVLLLAVPDLVIFRPEQAADPSIALETGIIQFHQNFILGPANEVVHGGAVLAGTASQYGVGPVYLLAGWLQLAPEGYGAFGLLDDILTALLFGAAYGVLRLAGVPRLLAAGAMAVAVVALILNLVYPVGALPQQGPLRFGLPMALILVRVAGARWPGRAGAARIASWALVGLSSVWALEAFAYTLATFVGLLAFEAWGSPAPERRPRLLREAVGAASACLCAHLLLIGLTLVLAGRLPDYGQYFAFLDAFLFKGLGDLTYDFSPWSAGLAVGGAYFSAAAALIMVLLRRPELARRERTLFLALAGMTAYGIALFSYFVDRSADHILPYVSLPAVVLGALWLSLVLREPGIAPRVRLGGLAFALALGVLLLSTAWSSVGERLPRTALVRALPGGEGLRASLDRLWHPPPLDERAPAAEALIERYFPGSSSVPILVAPDLEVETLVRSGRTDYFGLADPWEDSFVPGEHLADLDRAVAALRPGSLLLTQTSGLREIASLRSRAVSRVLASLTATGVFAPLQEYALKRIGQRFRLRPVHRDATGFVVARLVPRR
jgi:hypothetical protein